MTTDLNPVLTLRQVSKTYRADGRAVTPVVERSLSVKPGQWLARMAHLVAARQRRC